MLANVSSVFGSVDFPVPDGLDVSGFSEGLSEPPPLIGGIGSVLV